MAGGVKPGTAPAAQRPQGVGGGGRSSVPVEKACRGGEAEEEEGAEG